MPFKNIIFDLGGVFLNLDFARTHAAFRALGTRQFDALWSPAIQASLFEDYEKGLLDDAAFRQGLRKQLQLESVDDAALDAAWNAMILDIPADRLAWLEQVGKQYRVFLLSNTNTIHLEQIRHHALPKDGRAQLSDYFEHAYYSCAIHQRKPDAESFLHVLREQQLDAAQTLFVDDLQMNVDAARGVGLQARLMTKQMVLPDVLR